MVVQDDIILEFVRATFAKFLSKGCVKLQIEPLPEYPTFQCTSIKPDSFDISQYGWFSIQPTAGITRLYAECRAMT